MQKSVVFTGKTEDAAIAAALDQLGLSREEISVEVLELAKTGFLGIGSSPAKVKVTYEVADEPVAEPEVPVEPQVEEPVAAPAAPKEEPAAQPTAVESEDRTGQIVDFVGGLLSRMDIQAEVKVSVDAEGNHLVELVGPDMGPVIGRRGETLDAIQQLTGYAVNHGQAKRVRVRVDAEGYRAKREESLERMAHRVADKVVRYRRNMTLEPMNAYERHVIHTALQDHPRVTTYSVGVEPNRRIVVAYEVEK